MYFNVNFNVFLKLIKVHLLVSVLYIVKVYLPVHKLCLHLAKFEILRTVFIKIKIFWDVETCRRFDGA